MQNYLRLFLGRKLFVRVRLVGAEAGNSKLRSNRSSSRMCSSPGRSRISLVYLIGSDFH